MASAHFKLSVVAGPLAEISGDMRPATSGELKSAIEATAASGTWSGTAQKKCAPS